jgi:hypothetical protein
MITLNVPEAHSEYSGINGIRFTKVVSSFILKLAVITPVGDEELEDYYKGSEKIEKSSESKESYFEEAKLQQTIWKRSIAGGRPELCPSVANFSLFDNTDSTDFLIFLRSKVTTPELGVAIDYLLRQIVNPDWSIGVIVMPTIRDSVQFWDFVQDHKPLYDKKTLRNRTILKVNEKNMEAVTDAYAYVTAQIVSLFIDIGVVHFDLHMGNSLIYESDGIKSVIIDFGRASDITIQREDEYFPMVLGVTGEPEVPGKTTLFREKNDYYKEFFTLAEAGSEKDKRDFIIRVLDTVADIGFKKNRAHRAYSKSNAYQMDWYEDYDKFEKAPLKAFEILKELIDPSNGKKGMPATTLYDFEKKGNLVNFKKPLDEFIVKFPPPRTPSPRTPRTPRTPSPRTPRRTLPPLSIYPGRNMGFFNSIRTVFGIGGTKKKKYKKTRRLR